MISNYKRSINDIDGEREKIERMRRGGGGGKNDEDKERGAGGGSKEDRR